VTSQLKSSSQDIISQLGFVNSGGLLSVMRRPICVEDLLVHHMDVTVSLRLAIAFDKLNLAEANRRDGAPYAPYHLPSSLHYSTNAFPAEADIVSDYTWQSRKGV